jgi:hypothetical protein
MSFPDGCPDEINDMWETHERDRLALVRSCRLLVEFETGYVVGPWHAFWLRDKDRGTPTARSPGRWPRHRAAARRAVHRTLPPARCRPYHRGRRKRCGACGELGRRWRCRTGLDMARRRGRRRPDLSIRVLPERMGNGCLPCPRQCFPRAAGVTERLCRVRPPDGRQARRSGRPC